MSGREEQEDRSDLEDGDPIEPVDEEADELDESFEEEIEEDAETDDFSDDFEADEDLKVVDEVLNHKDSNARALAIRRAIEERLEAKRLSKDLDYLDLDADADN